MQKRTMNYYSFPIVSLLFTAVSIIGVFLPETAYVTLDGFSNLLVNHIIDLIVSIILLSLWFGLRSKNKHVDLTLAALLFYIYNLIPFFIQVHSLPLRLISASIILVSAWAYYIEIKNYQATMTFSKQERMVYGFLVLTFSFLFLGRGAALAVEFLSTGMVTNEFAVAQADIVICSLWLVTAISLIRNLIFGRKAIPSVLLQASLLFLSLIIIMLFQTLITGMAHSSIDFLFIGIMAILFFALTGWIIRKRF